jgi:class 3 adenylate cyclase
MPPEATEPRRRSALDEARERESAMLAILRVINQSRMDYQPVFDVILEYATKFCHAPFANLNIVNDDQIHLDFVAHWGSPLKSFQPGWQWPIDSPMVIARAAREKRTIHVHDLADDVLYRQGDPLRIKIVDEEGVRTFVAVPLISGDQAIGSIGLFRREVAPFSGDQIELVQTFAEQAVIAIENVRQFRALKARTRELNEALTHKSAASEVLETISASLGSVEPVYEAILSKALQHCESRFGVLLRPCSRGFHVAAHLGLPDKLAGFLTNTSFVPSEGTGIDRAIATGLPAQSQDIQDIGQYPDPEAASADDFRRAVAELGGGRSAISVPLINDDELVGLLIIFRARVRPFSGEQIALLKTFADQAVIAIENARLFDDVQDRSRELAELNHSLEERVTAQVNELERLGRLKRFLSPAVVEAVISSGDERLLSSHRALISVLFADIRGFTAFCETTEPEEAIEVLQTYHEAMGELLATHHVGVDHRSGDGIMAIFNDPLPCDDPAGDAVRLALAMREQMQFLCSRWRRVGHHLGFGVGITLGYATVGLVGSEGRYDYTASGTTVNLAARLCDEAADGEILLSPRACTAVEAQFDTSSHGKISFKGIQAPIEVHRLTGAKSS